jgi:hypothetical protein
MNGVRVGQSIWIERLLTVVLSTAYLVVFNRTAPHGDALRVVRQIQNQDLIWNPNHLIFDPFGYGWVALLRSFGASITELDAFEIISGASAVASLLIFHAVLLQLGVRRRGPRILALVGLFASQGFLSMSINQYYFMMQMPFLLGILYLAVRFAAEERAGRHCPACLWRMGVFGAIAGAITFNNVLLIGAMGLAAGAPVGRKRRSWNLGNIVRVWAPAAAIGFPIFIGGYLLSGTSAGFLQWVLSYQGESETRLNELYGIEWTLRGVAVSVARATFYLVSASVIETAGMGSTIRALVFREPLEFVPETAKALLALSLTPIVTGTVLLVLLWAVRHVVRDRLAQFGVAWVGAFYVFNVLWGSSGDQFYFQMLPLLWVLLMDRLSPREETPPATPAPRARRWGLAVLAFAVPALLAVNTLQTVVPVSIVDIESRRAAHMALLREGDLEIVPGWDGYAWLDLDPAGPRVERLTLMEMALQAPTSDRHIQQLPAIVARHLAQGRRVVVGRLYDKDRGINPWYGLARLGWPRQKIQTLLSRYCGKEIGAVGDVVFRELSECR